MSFGDVVGILLFVALMCSSLLQIVGIGIRRRSIQVAARHSDLDSKPERPREGLFVRANQWRRRPRARLNAGDWLPHSGFLFLPSVVGLALVCGGVVTLASPHQSFRLGGVIAIIAGLPVVTLLVLFGLRPTDSGTGRFNLRAVGYDPTEVDSILETRVPRTSQEVRSARFSTTRPGYDMHEVDRLLDASSDRGPVDPFGIHRAST